MDKEKETSNKPNFIKEKWEKLKEYINKKYEKQLKYFKERKKKVDRYFVIILSMLTSLSIYMLYERKIINQENIYVLMAILTISFIVYIFSIRKNFKSKNINELDKAIYISNRFLITLLFMIIIIKSIKNRDLLLIYNLTKRLIQRNITISFTVIITSIIIVLTVLSLILIIRRFFLFKKINNTKETQLPAKSQSQPKEKNNKKMCTLEDILYVKFEEDNIDKIIIKDSDDDIPDVFKVDRTKEELKIAINKFSTIGIVGEWGSGKSTIINSTIKELDKNTFILIRDFDPWTIKSQDSLILAMYNIIMENLGENISYYKRKKVQNALINISTHIPYVGKGIGSYLENRIDDYTEYKEIKVDLEEKLKKFNKRLIFIIDNLDRMKSDNVIFLLTLIETLFKLPNITYIVAYDRNRLNTIFKHEQINSKYIEKIINKEIFMPILDRNTLEECLEILLNIYNYNLQNSKVIKTICKRFTNIRQFIHFCNYLTIKPDFLNELNKQKIESDYFIIQAIKYLDYNTYLNIYNDRESLVDIKHRTETISNKYKDYEDLMYLLFSESENRKHSILNPVLFKLCYLPIESNIRKIKYCLDDLISNYKYFSQEYEELENSNYDKYQKILIIDCLNLKSHLTKYDIMYSFSLLESEIAFNLKNFKDKIVLWDLFSKCTSHNENSLYNLIRSNKDIPKLRRYLDENIVSVLLAIFESFRENNDINRILDNIHEDYKKDSNKYCKKMFMYEYNFNEISNKNLNFLIDKMYEPIFNNPIIIKDEDFYSKFYSYLTKRYDTWSYKIINYIDKLLCKAVTNGENLYEFINFFIIERSLFYNLSHLISDIILNSTYIHDLIEKYPPKDEKEEKIKKDFKEKYPPKK
ncbi:P-loop NTPase fold protein [Parvimonas sp. D2]|uniref:KAP family P-loop NTPase fold protein n=1 Tax=unclassified Parvimonas TaxID=1151464 RepID=UPI002B4811F3|nr:MULTISPECIES: P-loop NTPase fold protein [unclassified Parvimonas]MEB3012604.1 P-loop NTPase fold protein [Parvimonas sp. D2]MEB3088047.1 P-loop NTPase fold protein [Parvimonas sp. D4]